MGQPIILNRGPEVVYVSTVGGVTADQARHNSSNVGGVTAGQVRHNSSAYITGSSQQEHEVQLQRSLGDSEH